MKRFSAITLTAIFVLLLAFSHAIFAGKSYGTISGKLAWPGESIPPMKICAQRLNHKAITCMKLTAKNYHQAKYQWKLPVGKYYIFAHVLNKQAVITPQYRAYYSEFVTCGIKASCRSHKPIPVIVQHHKQLKNINPIDWYN